jgi:hypothetical protein
LAVPRDSVRGSIAARTVTASAAWPFTTAIRRGREQDWTLAARPAGGQPGNRVDQVRRLAELIARAAA